jgi:hypothetical protein
MNSISNGYAGQLIFGKRMIPNRGNAIGDNNDFKLIPPRRPIVVSAEGEGFAANGSNRFVVYHGRYKYLC